MSLNALVPRHISPNIVSADAVNHRDEGVTLVRAQPSYYATMSQRSDVTQSMLVQVPTSQQQVHQLFQQRPPPPSLQQQLSHASQRRMSASGLQPLR
uniref:Uncharacterized protein n=1 Tax=Ciona savignyi TaxID=51511 RepID=H2Z4G4_CIOSA